MISQSVRLLKIQLLRGFGINEVVHCRDGKKKGRLILMLSVYILLGVMLAFYTAGAAFILCFAGAAERPYLFLPYLKRDRFCFPQGILRCLQRFPSGLFPSL